MAAQKEAKRRKLLDEAIKEQEATPSKGGLTIPKWFWRTKS